MIYSKEYWNDVSLVIRNIPNKDCLRGKTVFMTGGTGLIGSTVVDILCYLNKEMDMNINVCLGVRDESKARARFNVKNDHDNIKFIFFDATKENVINVEADYIIYAAGGANPTAYSLRPVETILSNLVGLNSILYQYSHKSIGRLLYISSSEVYGKKNNRRPYEENEYGYVDILNSRSCYPLAKRLAENLCISYYKEYGVNIVIARPGHIYGPNIMDGDDRASAQFSRNAIAKSSIILKSNGEQIRSYCYSLDCASAILAILINGNVCEAYNISNPDSIISIRTLANEFSQQAGTNLVFENPTDSERCGYNLMNNSSLDSGKLEKLGWRGMFDLTTGVGRTIKFLKG